VLLDESIESGSSKPAILITGAHHARELITVQMVLFSILKLIQGGIEGNDEDII
jgi:murein tripeptide amidase MpaA